MPGCRFFSMNPPWYSLGFMDFLINVWHWCSFTILVYSFFIIVLKTCYFLYYSSFIPVIYVIYFLCLFYISWTIYSIFFFSVFVPVLFSFGSFCCKNVCQIQRFFFSPQLCPLLISPLKAYFISIFCLYSFDCFFEFWSFCLHCLSVFALLSTVFL